MDVPLELTVTNSRILLVYLQCLLGLVRGFRLYCICLATGGLEFKRYFWSFGKKCVSLLVLASKIFPKHHYISYRLCLLDNHNSQLLLQGSTYNSRDTTASTITNNPGSLSRTASPDVMHGTNAKEQKRQRSGVLAHAFFL